MADDPTSRLAKMAAEAADPADREWAKAKLAAMGGAAPAAPAAQGMTPERFAELQAKHAKNQQEIAAIKAEPEESPVAAGVRGLATGLSDVADTATFGGYRKLRDKALAAVDPDTLQTIQRSENEFHAAPGGGAVRTLAGALGYGLGPAGLVGKLGGAIAKTGGILAGGLGGAVSGGLTAGAEAAVAGDDPLKAAGVGALGGGVLGAAGGLAGRVLGNAPERAAESELAGLKEGVQNKSRVGKFVPREEDIRAELNQSDAKSLRSAIKTEPAAALPKVEAKLKDIAETQLNPFYERLEASGKDGVPLDTVVNNLKSVRAGFNKYAEKGATAVVDDLIENLTDDAIKNGGVIPARTLRETATAFQGQGFANLPMFGQIPLGKETKQGIGNALRGAVGDHVESIASDPDIGKAYRDAFEAANKRVSTWYTIRDLVQEKTKRLKGDAVPMADIVKGVAHAASHPFMSALPFIEPGADALNRRVLAPMVSSSAGQAAVPAARAVQSLAPQATGAALARRILHPEEEDAIP